MKSLLRALGGFLTVHWPAVLLVAFVVGLHLDLLLWAVPATGDHMIHLYKGWLMAEHQLPSGRISGWSNMAFAGYPAGVYYPVLGDLLITGARWLSFGLFSWERTYAVAFLLLVVAIPLTVYTITRRATAGRIGPLAAGVLAAGDVGGWPQGGHVSTVHWAVWPFILGLTLTLLSVRICEGAVTRPVREQPVRFLAFVVLLALSVLGHPMSAFFLGLSAPLFVVILALARRRQESPWRVIERAALAAALGALLAAFWIVPWITTGTEWTLGWPAVGFGGMWMSLPKLARALAVNDLFYDFYWATWLLGGAGLVLAFVTRRRWPIYLAVLFVVVFLFVGLVNALGDGLMARKVQIERMAAFMKMIWFALAGIAVDRIGAGLDWLLDRLPARWRAERLARWRSRARPAVGVAFVAALVLVGWSENFAKVVRIGRLGGALWDDIVAAEEWLAAQPRGPLDRVLYQPGELCVSGKLTSAECNEVYHRHLFASGPVRTGLPKIKFGYEATAIFRNVPLAHRWPHDSKLIQRLLTKPEAMESLHIRWLVSLVPWPGRDDLEEARRFGDVWIYTVKPGQGPPVRLEGAGDIVVERFEDEHVAVRVRGAAPGARLLFPIAHFYPWRAYRDGAPVALDKHGVLPHVRQILIAVEAADGLTELRYERPWWERLANWVSLAGWVACLGVVGAAALRMRRRARQ